MSFSTAWNLSSPYIKTGAHSQRPVSRLQALFLSLIKPLIEVTSLPLELGLVLQWKWQYTNSIMTTPQMALYPSLCWHLMPIWEHEHPSLMWTGFMYISTSFPQLTPARPSWGYSRTAISQLHYQLPAGTPRSHRREMSKSDVFWFLLQSFVLAVLPWHWR